MKELTLAQHPMCKKRNVYKKKDMFNIIIRLDLLETLAKTQKRQPFNTKSVIKSSFPIKAKIGETYP